MTTAPARGLPPTLLAPWMAVAGLALVALWSDIGRATGVSFAAWAVVALFLFTGGALAVPWLLRDVETRPTKGLFVPALAVGVLVMLVQHATSDDTTYLPMVVRAVARPADALSFRMEYIHVAAEAPVSPWVGTGDAFDFLQGAVVHLTGLPLLVVRHLLGPFVVGTLGVLAWLGLAVRLGWRPRAAGLAGAGLGLAVLLLLRGTEQAPGCALLLRTCQAKFAAVLVGYPLAAAAVLDLVETGRARAAVRLAVVATAIGGCGLSASVLFLLFAGVTAGAALFAARPDTASGARRLAAAAAACAAPEIRAVAAAVDRGGDFSAGGLLQAGYSPDLLEQIELVFPGPFGLAVIAAAAALAPGLLPRNGRRFLIAWLAGGAALLALPGLGHLVLRIVTPNVYWRTWLVMPWLVVLPLAGARVAGRLPERGRLPVTLLLAALALAAQVPLQLSGAYARTQLVFPLPDPDRCLNATVAADARVLAAVLPPGPVLAPTYLSTVLAHESADHPVVVHYPTNLGFYLEATRGRDHVLHRITTGHALAGRRPLDLDSLDALLGEVPEVRAVVTYRKVAAAAAPGERLAALGFREVDTGRPDLRAWTR